MVSADVTGYSHRFTTACNVWVPTAAAAATRRYSSLTPAFSKNAILCRLKNASSAETILFVVGSHPQLDDKRVAHASRYRRHVVHPLRVNEYAIACLQLVQHRLSLMPRDEMATFEACRLQAWHATERE